VPRPAPTLATGDRRPREERRAGDRRRLLLATLQGSERRREARRGADRRLLNFAPRRAGSRRAKATPGGRRLGTLIDVYV
jgi:hypothetical protein